MQFKRLLSSELVVSLLLDCYETAIHTWLDPHKKGTKYGFKFIKCIQVVWLQFGMLSRWIQENVTVTKQSFTRE